MKQFSQRKLVWNPGGSDVSVQADFRNLSVTSGARSFAFWSKLGFRLTFSVSGNRQTLSFLEPKSERIHKTVYQTSTMLSAEETSGFFPPDNADMDMHKHGQRNMQG